MSHIAILVQFLVGKWINIHRLLHPDTASIFTIDLSNKLMAQFELKTQLPVAMDTAVGIWFKQTDHKRNFGDTLQHTLQGELYG